VGFDGSRRLFGPSPWLDGPGVVLEGQCPPADAEALVAAWATTVRRVAGALGWPPPDPQTQVRGGHCTLAFTPPPTALLTGTELNEWAWEAALAAAGHPLPPPHFAPGDLPREATGALRALRARAALEARAPLPEVAIAPRSDQRVALVTGSNGKTTTTRLLAAMTRAAGSDTGWSCTDGVFRNDTRLERGDWSGPGGAQRVVRDPGVTCAILETARGGILRRGLGIIGAQVAVVTNVQADHFGEYGVTTLADLAAVKLTVTKGLARGGVLVRNAEDPSLRAFTPPHDIASAWFGEHAATIPDTARAAWAADGHLLVREGGMIHDFGDLRAMPLTAGGAARYNVANLLAAAVAGTVLGVPIATIRETCHTFGRDPADNAGRLALYRLDGMELLLDYAHNPDGLAGLLSVARSRQPARLLLLLGQAGNRDDAALTALAQAAWGGQPDCVILKDLEGYQRGRAVGEVANTLAAALQAAGMRADQLRVVLDEAEAVAAAIAWGQPGDLLVLPVHALDARDRVAALLASRGAAPIPWEPQAG
jgi:UDP-N-acetylmuramyl tripeptide synthase